MSNNNDESNMNEKDIEIENLKSKMSEIVENGTLVTEQRDILKIENEGLKKRIEQLNLKLEKDKASMEDLEMKIRKLNQTFEEDKKIYLGNNELLGREIKSKTEEINNQEIALKRFQVIIDDLKESLNRKDKETQDLKENYQLFQRERERERQKDNEQSTYERDEIIKRLTDLNERLIKEKRELDEEIIRLTNEFENKIGKSDKQEKVCMNEEEKLEKSQISGIIKNVYIVPKDFEGYQGFKGFNDKEYIYDINNIDIDQKMFNLLYQRFKMQMKIKKIQYKSNIITNLFYDTVKGLIHIKVKPLSITGSLDEMLIVPRAMNDDLLIKTLKNLEKQIRQCVKKFKDLGETFSEKIKSYDTKDLSSPFKASKINKVYNDYYRAIFGFLPEYLEIMIKNMKFILKKIPSIYTDEKLTVSKIKNQEYKIFINEQIWNDFDKNEIFNSFFDKFEENLISNLELDKNYKTIARNLNKMKYKQVDYLVNIYKTKINQLTKRHEEEMLSVSPLKKETNNDTNVIDLQNEIELLIKKNESQSQMFELHLQELDGKNVELQETLTSQLEKYREIQVKLEKSTEDIDKINQIKELLEKKISIMADDHLKTTQTLKSQLRENGEELQKMKIENENLNINREDLNNKLDRIKKENLRLSELTKVDAGEYNNIKKALKETTKEVDKLNQVIRSLEENINTIKEDNLKQRETFERSINEKKEEVEKVKAEIEQLKEREEKYLIGNKNLNQDLLKEKNTVNELKSNFSKCLKNADIVSKQNEELLKQNEELLKQNEELLKQNKLKESIIDLLRNKGDKIEIEDIFKKEFEMKEKLLNEREEKLTKELEEAQKENKKILDIKDGYEKNIQNLTQEVLNKQKRIEDTVLLLEKRNQLVSELEESNKQLSQKIFELSNKEMTFEKQLNENNELIENLKKELEKTKGITQQLKEELIKSTSQPKQKTSQSNKENNVEKEEQSSVHNKKAKKNEGVINNKKIEEMKQQIINLIKENTDVNNENRKLHKELRDNYDKNNHREQNVGVTPNNDSVDSLIQELNRTKTLYEKLKQEHEQLKQSKIKVDNEKENDTNIPIFDPSINDNQDSFNQSNKSNNLYAKEYSYIPKTKQIFNLQLDLFGLFQTLYDLLSVYQIKSRTSGSIKPNIDTEEFKNFLNNTKIVLLEIKEELRQNSKKKK